jgi:hypothetical protein
MNLPLPACLSALVLCCLYQPAGIHQAPAPPTAPALEAELVKLSGQEHDIEAVLSATLSAGRQPEPATLKRLADLRAANAVRLKEIVAQTGWPTPAQVGADGVSSALTILKQADPALQEALLPSVEAAVHAGAVPGKDYAELVDTLRVSQKRPQIYGTQVKSLDAWKNGHPEVEELEDPGSVDSRRASVGLMPLKPYLAMMGQGFAQAHWVKHPATPPKLPDLRTELLAMVQRDQDARNALIAAGIAHPPADLVAKMTSIDSANETRMRVILKQYGWPNPDLVGNDGAEAAFLLIQHAPLDLQQQALPLVKAAYLAHGLAASDYALLADRVLMRSHKPQIYGTQLTDFKQWTNGVAVPSPIADPTHVDRRRAALGMSPLADYLVFTQWMYFPGGKKP